MGIIFTNLCMPDFKLMAKEQKYSKQKLFKCYT